MKKTLFIFILSLFASVEIIFASNTSVDGIYYDFDDTNLTATVTYRGSSYSAYSNEYSGDVNIPQTVTYSGKTYSVTSIEGTAFYNCSSLTSVTIGESVTSIGDHAFYGCSSLTSVTIGESVTSIGRYAFYGCSSLTSVTIGESVTSIGEYAFYGCTSLTSVTIPNSVTSIEGSAFSNCSRLTSVTIGESVTSIGNYAFDECKYLSTMIFKGVNPPNASGLVDSGTPVCYIPCGSLEAYILRFCNDMKQFIEHPRFEISVSSSNASYGVAKLVSQPDCESAILTAIPNEGCKFVKWSDGNTQATRYLELTGDVTLTAEFVKEGYTIHVNQDCSSTLE